MKITIITGPFGCIPPYALGAIEKRWYNTGKILQEKGNTITFISKRPPLAENNDNCQHLYIKGYNRTGNFKKDLILDFIYSFKTLITLRETDIVVLNSIFSPILCRFFKNKFKVSVYNVARFPKGQIKYYSNIDRLSCVSLAVKNALIKQTPSVVTRAKVISNPVDTNSFYYRKPHKGNEFIISYSGRVHPEKGLEILVSAYAILCNKYPQLRLKIIGPQDIRNGGGGDEYINKLASLAGKNKIDWITPIEDASLLSDEIEKCDIFCYPSVAEMGETFGVAPLEAMANGRATIVSALECFKDFVIENYNALIFDHRTNAINNLISKIELLINNDDLRNTLAINAANSVKENFNTNIIAEKYLEDFHELLQMK